MTLDPFRIRSDDASHPALLELKIEYGQVSISIAEIKEHGSHGKPVKCRALLKAGDAHEAAIWILSILTDEAAKQLLEDVETQRLLQPR